MDFHVSGPALLRFRTEGVLEADEVEEDEICSDLFAWLFCVRAVIVKGSRGDGFDGMALVGWADYYGDDSVDCLIVMVGWLVGWSRRG